LKKTQNCVFIAVFSLLFKNTVLFENAVLNIDRRLVRQIWKTRRI